MSDRLKQVNAADNLGLKRESILGGLFRREQKLRLNTDGTEIVGPARYRANPSAWIAFLRNYKSMNRTLEFLLACGVKHSRVLQNGGDSKKSISRYRTAQRRYQKAGDLFFHKWGDPWNSLIEIDPEKGPMISAQYFHSKASHGFFLKLAAVVRADRRIMHESPGRPAGPDPKSAKANESMRKEYRKLKRNRPYDSHRALCKELQERFCLPITPKALERILRPLSHR